MRRHGCLLVVGQRVVCVLRNAWSLWSRVFVLLAIASIAMSGWCRWQCASCRSSRWWTSSYFRLMMARTFCVSYLLLGMLSGIWRRGGGFRLFSGSANCGLFMGSSSFQRTRRRQGEIIVNSIGCYGRRNKAFVLTDCLILWLFRTLCQLLLVALISTMHVFKQASILLLCTYFQRHLELITYFGGGVAADMVS